MIYAVDSGRAQTGPACTLENRVSPACGSSAQGIRAGGVLHLDGFGPVYLAPMPGGRAADRTPSRDGLDVSSLNCAAGAACAGGDFLGGVA